MIIAPNWIYTAVCNRVVDGDTLILLVDQGFNNFTEAQIRLYGINTPETYGVSKESEEYKKGMEAKAFVVEWLQSAKNKVFIKSYDGKKIHREKYGRWLAEIYKEGTNQSLNNALVEAKLAVAVDY